MRVHITRRGGIAGIPLSAEFDTGTLEAEHAARVEQAVSRMVQGEGEESEAPLHPDAFEYEIALPEDGKSTRVRESDMPDELRPLVKELVARGKLG